MQNCIITICEIPQGTILSPLLIPEFSEYLYTLPSLNVGKSKLNESETNFARIEINFSVLKQLPTTENWKMILNSYDAVNVPNLSSLRI